MKHLKLFNDAASYEAWKNSEDYVLPNVIFSEETGVVYEAVKEMKTAFNCDSYDDRKELYDLIFNKVLWGDLSTPIYLYYTTGPDKEIKTINYCLIGSYSVEYGDWATLTGILHNGDPAYYRIEPENDYAIKWDD